MAIQYFNTLTRQLEPFTPRESGRVSLYTCGPTVYNYAHIGNFRAYAFEDLLQRHLEYRGHTVTRVMNLTDVDDKTIRAAAPSACRSRSSPSPSRRRFSTISRRSASRRRSIFPRRPPRTTSRG